MTKAMYATPQSTWALVALLATASACDDSPNFVVELGRLEFYDMRPRVEAPRTIGAAGAPLAITIQTYGGGCISFESTEVTVLEHEAVIELYDRRRIPGENEGCTADLRYISHDTQVTFTTAGSKTIRILGRRVGPPPIDEPMEFTFQVTIE